MKSSHGHSAESALAVLLDALALVLIALEITPGRLAQIARTSFVKAGARQARMRSSGRPHLAKIAALTGLSRLEVKRIVAANYGFGDADAESSPRAVRVMNAWQHSKTYSKRGKPRSLKIAGRAPSFHSLCKAHSGDIPYKVILDELVRRRRVVVTRARTQVSISTSRQPETVNQKERNALVFAAAFLDDALRHDAVLVRRAERVGASQEIPDTYVENAIANRVTELLNQMPQLFVRKSRQKRNIVNVFALVARSRARR